MSIISPWIIYLIALLDTIDSVSIFGLVVGFGGLIFFSAAAMEEDDINDEAAAKYRRLAKKIKWIGIIALILLTIIPSRKDMYTMLVADTVTYEMVDTVGEGVRGTVDYVVDAVDQMLNGEEE